MTEALPRDSKGGGTRDSASEHRLDLESCGLGLSVGVHSAIVIEEVVLDYARTEA